MVDTRKKDGKRKKITEDESFKNLKKFNMVKAIKSGNEGEDDVHSRNIIRRQKILKLRIQSLIPTAEEKDRMDLGGLYFFNVDDVDRNVNFFLKVEDVGFSISDVKDVIDARFRSLEKKVFELKKDIEHLGADIKDEMRILQVEIVREMRVVIRKELRGHSNISEGGNKGDSDDDDNKDEDDDAFDDADSDDDDDDDDDGSKGKEKDNDDDGSNVNEKEDDDGGSKVDENDDDETDTVKEVDYDVTLEESHDVGHGSDVSNQFVLKNDDDEDNVKISKNNDMPSFDILSQSTGKELVIYVGAELIKGYKIETESMSALDQMILTTQDIAQCVEVERSVHKPGGRLVRERTKNVVLRSPYTTKFGSASSSSTAVGSTQIRRGLSAFPKVCMSIPSKYEDALFDQWFKIGLNNRKMSVPISSKMWFYKLKTPGQWLDDDPNRSQMRTKIMDICEPYIFILPTILSKTGFWKHTTDIDFKSEPYRNKEEQDIIKLEFVEGVPEQIEGDCGMFTICFPEHVIHQQFAEIPVPFPIAQYQKKLCVNLYMHARTK